MLNEVNLSAINVTVPESEHKANTDSYRVPEAEDQHRVPNNNNVI